jgi:hypothetical protein
VFFFANNLFIGEGEQIEAITHKDMKWVELAISLSVRRNITRKILLPSDSKKACLPLSNEKEMFSY